MDNETEKTASSAPSASKSAFKKIPPEIIFSPGGIVLLFFAGILSLVDFIIPIPILNTLLRIPFEIIFMILLVVIAGVPLKSLISSFLISLIPFLGGFVWIIKMAQLVF